MPLGQSGRAASNKCIHANFARRQKLRGYRPFDEIKKQNKMRTKITITTVLTILIHVNTYSQVFYWEKIEEAAINGDSVCYAYIGGFPIYEPEPTMYNLNGSLDYFIGTGEGFSQIIHIENVNNKENPCWVLRDEFFGGIEVPQGHRPSTPYFVGDIVGDSLPDIVIGRSNGGGNNGNISLYENISVGTDYQFELVEDTLFGITFYDFVDPCAKDVDKDGDIDFVIGNGPGDVYFIRNLGNNVWGNIDTIYHHEGFEDDKASPDLGDFIGNDSIPELLVGDASGKLKLFTISYYDQDTVIWELTDSDYIYNKGFTNETTGKFVNPILVKYDEDELMDLVLASWTSDEFVWLKNVGDLDSAMWEIQTSPLPFNNFPNSLNFSAGDIDNDSIPELLFLVDFGQNLVLYINEASLNEEPEWVFHSNLPIDSFFLSLPPELKISEFSIYDIDNDGYNDIIAVSDPPNPDFKKLIFLKNLQNNYQFEYVQDTTLEVLYPSQPYRVPALGDFDSDNDADMIIYIDSEYLHFEYQNATSSWEEVSSTIFNPLIVGDLSIIDFDEDGNVDLVGKTGTGFNFYKNIGIPNSLEFELQEPTINYRPPNFNGEENVIFGEFDGQCGKDIILKGNDRGILIWGFRGIVPEISLPSKGDMFEDCDTTLIELHANPSNGGWSGHANQDGTFQPSTFSPGEYEMIYTYSDENNCYTNSDTLIINIVDCIIDQVNEIIPYIGQVYVNPNPSKNSFSIRFNLSKSSNVQINLISYLGQKHALYQKHETAGQCEYVFAKPNFINSGLYIIEISTEKEIKSKKIIFN